MIEVTGGAFVRYPRYLPRAVHAGLTGCSYTAVVREGDLMPKTLRIDLPPGGKWPDGPGWPRQEALDRMDDTYYRRYARGVREEFRRAVRRRTFFDCWQPEPEREV